jgi:hypothetical protein
LFADDLVVVGGGRLIAAETVAAITARSTTGLLEDSLLDMTRSSAEFASL